MNSLNPQYLLMGWTFAKNAFLVLSTGPSSDLESASSLTDSNAVSPKDFSDQNGL